MWLRDGTVYHRLIWIGDFFSLWFVTVDTVWSSAPQSTSHFHSLFPCTLVYYPAPSQVCNWQLYGRFSIKIVYASAIAIACYVHIQPSTVWQYQFIIIIIIIIIMDSTALGGPWPPQANVATNLYPGHLPANFQNPVSLRLPVPCQSILISVGQVLVDLQGFAHNIFSGNSFSSIRTMWRAHLSLLDFITLTIFGSLSSSSNSLLYLFCHCPLSHIGP